MEGNHFPPPLKGPTQSLGKPLLVGDNVSGTAEGKGPCVAACLCVVRRCTHSMHVMKARGRVQREAESRAERVPAPQGVLASTYSKQAARCEC